MGMCMWVQCLKRPEEGAVSPGAGIMGCALLGIEVETELRSSERLVYTLN